jgi:hypothetical protein
LTSAPERKLDLSFPAQVGTAQCSSSGATGVAFYFAPDSYDAHATIDGSSCSYVITTVGAVGEVIEGSFTATLMSDTSNGSAPVSKAASGSFRVIRKD